MIRRHFMRLGAGTISGLTVALGASAASPAAQARLGQLAPAFELPDATGRRRLSTEFKGKVVVLEWSSPSCPFAAAQYTSKRMPTLQTWAKGEGVVWLTVLSSHPSRSDYLSGAQADAFNHQRGANPSALLIDASGSVGRAFGAMTANHMFIIVPDGTLVYEGGIDDSNSMQPDKVAASRNFVHAALRDITAGRSVSTPRTEPFGCALAYAG